jgi:hypothetical protein
LTEEFLDLRNRIHKGEFRLDLSSDLWKSHYLTSSEANGGNVLTIIENEKLKAYAVFSIQEAEGARAYKILEICSEGSEALSKLVDLILESAIEHKVDFVFLRESDENHGSTLRRKGFISFVDSTVSLVLLNPKEFLRSVAEDIHEGKIMRLSIKGFSPVDVKVGKTATMLVSGEKPDFVLSIDARMFLRLLFGKSSFFKEYLERNIKVPIAHWFTAKHFFELVRTKEWYIPSGDWC